MEAAGPRADHIQTTSIGSLAGRKDRDAMLLPVLLELLREWRKFCRSRNRSPRADRHAGGTTNVGSAPTAGDLQRQPHLAFMRM
jgi:hypothetical protein